MSDYLILFLGILAAGIGGELFVRGAVGLASWLRIPAGIIGATIAAFATSSPELAVSVNAALEGRPQMALGDALGSNIVNVTVILASALLFVPLRAPIDSIKRDFPVAIFAPLLTGLLLIDGELSRTDGLIMLAVFVAWLVSVVLEVRRQRDRTEEVLGVSNQVAIIFYVIGGLLALILAGRLIVIGAKGIALSFGLGEFVIGATVVAIGTSMPELATIIISKLKGHEEIGLGTILGSNIFNNFWIVSIATLIAPMSDLEFNEIATGLGFGALGVILTLPGKDGIIGRCRGLILLAIYLAYLITIFQL